jgi:hypothetical protein
MVAKKTVLQVFVGQSGKRQAIKAIEWLVEWGAVYERIGHAPGPTEFLRLTGRDRTTAWRYGSAFRTLSLSVPAEAIWKSLPSRVRKLDGRSPDVVFADVASSRWVLGDG